MDVRFFLRQRTKFVRQYYEIAVSPFETTKRKIENGEPPYEPSYEEQIEPPFLAEWMDAEVGCQIVGRTCVSLLSETLKAYLQTWERLLGLECRKHLPSVFKKRGFWNGYKECLQQHAAVDWRVCPADFSAIEQVIDARNISQHHDADDLAFRVQHPQNLRDKYPRPIFVYEHEKNAATAEDSQFDLLRSELIITEAALMDAVANVEALVDWLEPKLQTRRFWRL
jgi:hypothetical protein